MQEHEKKYEKRKIEDLNLIDDLLFNEASSDRQTAESLMRLILERSTGMKISRLKIVCCIP